MNTTTSVAGLPREVIDSALQNTANEVERLLPSDSRSNLWMYGGAVGRTAVAFLAGRGFGWAIDVSGDEASLIGFIFLGVSVLAWSLLQKRWAAWRVNQTARASAAASATATIITGVPTAVPLEPAPSKI